VSNESPGCRLLSMFHISGIWVRCLAYFVSLYKFIKVAKVNPIRKCVTGHFYPFFFWNCQSLVWLRGQTLILEAFCLLLFYLLPIASLECDLTFSCFLIVATIYTIVSQIFWVIYISTSMCHLILFGQIILYRTDY